MARRHDIVPEHHRSVVGSGYVWDHVGDRFRSYAGSTNGPVGPRPRALRLGGPRTWKMLLNKRKKEKVGREKKEEKRKREEKKGKKRKGR